MSKTSPVGLSFDSSAARAGALSVLSFQGVERLSRPFRFDIDVVSADPGVALDVLIGQAASLAVGRPGDEVIWRGVVTQVEEGLGRTGDRDVHRVTLEPRWSLLDLGSASRVLHGLTVPEAIMAVIAAEGGALGPGDVELRLEREHPKRDRLAQERESPMTFLSRLIEREGMVYFFAHPAAPEVRPALSDDGVSAPPPGEILIVTDDITLHPLIQGGRVPYGETGEPGGMFVSSLRRTSRVAARGEASARERGGVRVFRGESTCATLRAGHRFSVTGHPRADFARELVITEVRHRGHVERGYANELAALATEDLVRPERATAIHTPEATAECATPEATAAPGHETAPPGQHSSVWRVGQSRARASGGAAAGGGEHGAPRALDQQQHLTVDDTQNQRLDAVEQKNAAQDTKDSQHDQAISAIEAKNAAQDQKDAQQDAKLAAAAADTNNTWLRFDVPYGTNLTSYLRLGKAPTEGTDIETPLRSKLSLNTDSLDGHFEYTTGNRTVITGGNKEEIVDGKHRIAINSGGLGLFDADPIYFLDFSQDPSGAWRKSEFTHVSSSQFAIGDTSSWMMGVTGGYFLGIKVDVFASLALTVGLGINYSHVKGLSFQEAKTHDVKARSRITIRVKTQDPFFTHKNWALVGAGILAGGAAAVALAAANGRSDMGRATAAFGTGPTVGLATAASIAAILDVYKRVMRRAAADRDENDSIITVTEQCVDIKSGTNNTSVLVSGQNDEVYISTDNGGTFVQVAGPTGGPEMVHLFSTGTIRLHAPAIELYGAVDVHGNVHMFNNLQVDGNINGAPFAVAPPAPPPPPLPPPGPPAQGIFARVGAFLRLW